MAFDRHYVSKKALIIPDLDDEPEVTNTAKTPGKAILVDEIEVPEANIPDEILSAPKALIVEEAPVTPAPQPTQPIQPEEPSADPTSPEITEPEAPAQPVEPVEPIDDAPPLRDLPDGVNPDTPQSVPAPKAIPVE